MMMAMIMMMMMIILMMVVIMKMMVIMMMMIIKVQLVSISEQLPTIIADNTGGFLVGIVQEFFNVPVNFNQSFRIIFVHITIFVVHSFENSGQSHKCSIFSSWVPHLLHRKLL